MNYAAFIITYERGDILKNTIKSIFEQTLPPLEILIVDNSETFKTKQIIEDLNDPKINYFRVGFNAGPAGGAYFGLKNLTEKGYEWIFWGDDDDPPEEDDLIEKIFEILPEVDNATCGQLGKIGARFNKISGELVRYKDKELEDRILEVDGIGGGQCKIISSKIVKAGILPDKKLFFGFEELDFDLKIKKAGFKSYVSGKLFYESRKRSGRLNLKKKSYLNSKALNLNRQYYSVRNLLSIYKKNGLYTSIIYLTIKKIASITFSYSQGYDKGSNYTKTIILAYYHFLIGKYGKVDLNLKQEA